MLSPISCSSADSICSSKTQVCTLKFEPGQIPIVEHWGEDLRKYLLLHFFMRRVGGQKHLKKHRIKKIAMRGCYIKTDCPKNLSFFLLSLNSPLKRKQMSQLVKKIKIKHIIVCNKRPRHYNCVLKCLSIVCTTQEEG